MFQNLKVNARTVYILIEFSASVFFAMMFTVTSLFFIRRANFQSAGEADGEVASAD